MTQRDEFIPPDPRSSLDHLGTHLRTMPVTLERMIENALDWEHLPYVHDASFQHIECLESGPWGCRARISMGAQTNEIELRLNRDARRWITRTLSGPGSGAEVWTHALELGPAGLRVVVDFFLPGSAAEDRGRLGKSYARLYRRLYDEDEAMMIERDRAHGAATGDRSRARSRPAASTARRGGKRRTEMARGGTGRCPARVRYALPTSARPTRACPVADGIVRCPWHGYDFDLRSGDCRSGASCRIKPLPVIERQDHAWISL